MWKARLKNGQEVSELNTKWDDIKDEVTDLLLITKDNKTIYLPRGLEKYVQYKTGSVMMDGGGAQIESRSIGFKIGNSIVKIRVSESTGNILIETENG